MDRIGLNLTGFNSGLNSGQFTPQQLAMLLALRATSPGAGFMPHAPSAGMPDVPAAQPGGGTPRPVEPYGADRMPQPYKAPAPDDWHERIASLVRYMMGGQ